jgi:hypothetical protein
MGHIRDAKVMARGAAQCLGSKSYQKGFGRENWNVLSAKIECPTACKRQKRRALAFGQRCHQNAAIDHATVTRREPAAARHRCPRTNTGGLDQQADGFGMSTRPEFFARGPDGDCGVPGRKVTVDTDSGPASHGAVHSPARPPIESRANGRIHRPASPPGRYRPPVEARHWARAALVVRIIFHPWASRLAISGPLRAVMPHATFRARQAFRMV